MISKMCKCKRCGRVLKSPESIERGYVLPVIESLNYKKNPNQKLNLK